MEKQYTFKKLILDDLRSQKRNDIVAKIQSIRYETYSGGSSVRVRAINLTKSEREFMEALLREYQQGTFDGMTDCYNYDREHTKPRSAKFVFLNAEYSMEVQNKISDKLAADGITDDKTAMHLRGQWLCSLMHRELSQLEEIPC